MFSDLLELSTNQGQVGIATEISAHIALAHTTVTGPVELIEVSKSGEFITTLGTLLDNGNSNRDDVFRGDGIYSGKISLNSSQEGDRFLRVRVAGTTDDYSDIQTVQIINPTALADFETAQALSASVTASVGLVDQMQLTTLEVESKKDQMLQEYLSRDEVESAVFSPDRSTLSIHFKSGVSRAVIFREHEASSSIPTLGIQPLKTTRNLLSASSVGSFDTSYLSPFHNDWVLLQLEQSYSAYHNLINDSNYAFENVQTLLNEQVTVEELKNMQEVGIMILSTHGGVYTYLDGGLSTMLATKEGITEERTAAYQSDIDAGRVVPANVETLIWHGDIQKWVYQPTPHGIYAVTSRFFDKYVGLLPDSLIFIEACHGLDDGLVLTNTFMEKGARAVLAFEDSVFVAYAESAVRIILERLRAGDTLLQAVTFTKESIGYNDSEWFTRVTGQEEDNPTPSRLGVLGGDEARNLKLEKTRLVNASFDGGRRDWEALEQGSQGTFPSFAGQESIHGSSMMVAATIGHYSGYTQRINIPEDADTLNFQYNLVHEITHEQSVDLNAVPWRDQTFYVSLETDGGNETRLKTVTGKGSETWVPSETNQKCIRINEALYDSNPNAPYCATFKTGWETASLDIRNYRGQHVTLKLITQDDVRPVNSLSEAQDLYALVDNISIE